MVELAKTLLLLSAAFMVGDLGASMIKAAGRWAWAGIQETASGRWATSGLRWQATAILARFRRRQ